MHLHLLLALLPSAVAAATLAYTPPPALLAKVEAEADCALPKSYTIQDFVGRSNNTGQTLAAYNFTFVDTTTKVTTLCHYNSSSTSTTPPGLTPRFACEHGEIKFIWEDGDKDLWMIERVCPGPDGAADYEVSGSLPLTLACSPESGKCVTNSTAHEALFTSVQPVRDPTMLRARTAWRG